MNPSPSLVIPPLPTWVSLMNQHEGGWGFVKCFVKWVHKAAPSSQVLIMQRLSLLFRLLKHGRINAVVSLMFSGWLVDLDSSEGEEVNMLVTNSGTNLQGIRFELGHQHRTRAISPRAHVMHHSRGGISPRAHVMHHSRGGINQSTRSCHASHLLDKLIGTRQVSRL